MRNNLPYFYNVKLGFLGLCIAFGLTTSCKKDLDQQTQTSSAPHIYKTQAVPLENKDVWIGNSQQYDVGARTNVTINHNSQVIEVHKNEIGTSLWYKTGWVSNGVINWNGARQYDSGKDPSVAVNRYNTVVEVHKTQNPFSSGMFYHIGHFNGNTISWGGSHKYDNGSNPSVAINKHNVVVEVHKSQGKTHLWYHVGTVNSGNKTINFGGSIRYDTGGKEPTVAINDNNQVVVVHESGNGGSLWYRAGTIDPGSKKLHLGAAKWYGNGSVPAVCLQNDGSIFEIHRESGDNLYSKKGVLSGQSISWKSNRKFDTGIQPSVASNGIHLVQTHDATNTTGLWGSTALVTDHANWMYRNKQYIDNKKLKDIVIPGSHDAGMYPFSLGQTQSHSIYAQLKYGIRFFDLRPNTSMHAYHGPIQGSSMDEIFSHVKKYMDEGSRELVILKLSHYGDGFNSSHYATLINKAKHYLGNYLYTNKPSDKRIGDILIKDFLSDGGKVLLVCESNYPINQATEGIYTYRDWDNGDVSRGDLRIYDKYSNSMNCGTMKDDQLQKLNNYTGKTQNGNLDNDLFLLSWTLTPPTLVYFWAKEANRNLAPSLANINKNSHGRVPNILYVDFVQESHATDISIILNRRF